MLASSHVSLATTSSPTSSPTVTTTGMAMQRSPLEVRLFDRSPRGYQLTDIDNMLKMPELRYLNSVVKNPRIVLPEQIAVTRSYWLLVHEDLRHVVRIDAVCRFVTGLLRDHKGLMMGGA